MKISKEVTVSNQLGLHGRPAAVLVKMASKYHASIALCRPEDPDNPADCHSILSLLVLAATQGTKLLLSAEGDDAQPALDELSQFFAESFQE